MSSKIPTKVEKDSIVESICEIRFSSKEVSIAELLPGMLFSKLRERFPHIQNLPIKDIPLALRQSNESLKFQPVVRLLGQDCSIGIGEKVVALAITRPYIGWEKKKELISKLIDALKETDLIDKVERFSLKYVNIIPYTENMETKFDELNVELYLGELQLSGKGIELKAEVEMDGAVNIINITPDASMNKGDERVEGVLVTIDSIKEDLPENFVLDDILLSLEELHYTEKKVFFDVLKKETIDKMEPTWS